MKAIAGLDDLDEISRSGTIRANVMLTRPIKLRTMTATIHLQDLSQRNVSVGQALKAMVLNGLGFANRRLYLMSEFFRNKPTERLVGAGIRPEHLRAIMPWVRRWIRFTPSGSPSSTG